MYLLSIGRCQPRLLTQRLQRRSNGRSIINGDSDCDRELAALLLTHPRRRAYAKQMAENLSGLARRLEE
ncbi:MAG: hypothetical protein R2705_14480 [Ilumatobacteraceae bacterium]